MEKYLKPERLELDRSSRHVETLENDFWYLPRGRLWNSTTYLHDRQIEIETVKQPPFSGYFQTYSWHLRLQYGYECSWRNLREIFVNSVFYWHLLTTRRQQTDESVDQYLQSLKRLAKDCGFQAVTATQARDEYIRDAFINRITSYHIRQRLLENKTLDLNTSYDQALTLEMAPRQLASYSQPDSLTASVSTVQIEETDDCISVCDEQPTVAAILLWKPETRQTQMPSQKLNLQKLWKERAFRSCL